MQQQTAMIQDLQQQHGRLINPYDTGFSNGGHDNNGGFGNDRPNDRGPSKGEPGNVELLENGRPKQGIEPHSTVI